MTGMIRKNGIALMLLGLLLFACSTKDPRTLTTDSSMTINYEINGERFVIHPPKEYSDFQFKRKRACCGDASFEWRFQNDSLPVLALYFSPDHKRSVFNEYLAKARLYKDSISFLTPDSSVFRREWSGILGDTIYHSRATYYSTEKVCREELIWCRSCDEFDKKIVELATED